MINKLKAAKVAAEIARKTSTAETFADGGGLYLQRARSGAVSWIFRFKSPVTGKYRDMGLGSAHKMSLADAREKAADLRRKVHVDNIDPINEREKAGKGGRTFRQQFEHMTKHQPRPGWKEMLDLHVMPTLGDKLVTAVTTDDVIEIIAKQIAAGHHENARKLQMRIHAVIRSATGSPDTPAHKDRICYTLSHFKEIHESEPHPSLDHDRLPAFMRELRTRKEITACALEFVILTNCRTGDVTGQRRKQWPVKPPMHWTDIDRERRIWKIPAIKTASKRNPKPFEIPLSDAAWTALERVRALHSNTEIVFPMQQHLGKRRQGQRKGKDGPMDRGAMLDQITRCGHIGFTVHGFRTAFKTWAEQESGFPNNVIETAMAHRVFGKTKAEKAYMGKIQFFDARKALMQAWADYATGKRKGKIVAFKKAA